VPKVLQKKSTAAPPVYRPAPKKIVQPKAAAIAQSRPVRAAAPSAKPTSHTPGVLQKKIASRGPVPHVVQRQQTSRVIQRVGGADLVELEFFYNREIREIGSPTSARNRAVYALARQDATLDAAKARIRTHIAAWKRNLNNQAQEPAPGPSLRSPNAGMVPISSSDLSSALGAHTPRPSRLTVEGHRRLTYADMRALNAEERLYMMAELASEFGTTLYELQKRANTAVLQRMGILDYIDGLARQVRAGELDPDRIQSEPGISINGLVGVYYRYHKVADDDPVSKRFVTGGIYNKSEIARDELHQEEVRPYFKNRHSVLETLSSGTPLEKTKDMERAQASALHTPFIATTSDGAYARRLRGEYPPEPHQRGVLLTIIGPACNTFDFEREFEARDRGFSLFNMRTVAKRAKDRDQFEFGIPDLFIPVGAGMRSPLGFVVAKVEML
jgi:hypothetical protein